VKAVVDDATATGLGVGAGATMGAMIALPQAGKTLAQTIGLVLSNPAMGAATDYLNKKVLEGRSYDDQAKMFDPFDPVARSVDVILGGVFGGIHEYGRWRQQAPTEVVDAIDTAETVKHRENLNPFMPDTEQATAHGAALGKALDDIAEGQPVDVAERFADAGKTIKPSYTADRLRTDIKEAFGTTDEQADAAVALVAARAKVAGEALDAYVGKRIAGVRTDEPMPGAALFQSANESRIPNPESRIVQPFYSKVLAEVEGLQQEKWNAGDLLNKLRKTPGVKEEEIAFTGLDEFLTVQKRVTKEDVWSFLSDNQVRIEEVVKGEGLTDAEWTQYEELIRPISPLTEKQRLELAFFKEKIKGKVKFDGYALSGGENYRELLLTLPDKGFGKNYYGGHFDESNILAHVRFNERTGGAGERILHLEEVQSDWHQDRRAGKDVPDAPFTKSWHELAMKRMLRWAAENGFDRLTWTTGEQQAARYDISKVMDSVTYGRVGTIYHIKGMTVDGVKHEFGTFNESDLNAAVGKELGEKMKADKRQKATYEGLELKIGGEGMKGFYDKILPIYMEKFGRKFGARVEQAEILTNPESRIPVHGIPITEGMRNAVLYEGQPLFQGEKGAVSFLADGRAMIHALEAPDFSTVTHELAHVFEADLSAAERRDFDTWLHSVVPGTKWSTQQRELFARAFERYLAEGKAPVKELQNVFDKFKTWLLEVYRRIAGTAIDVKMNDNVRAAFDRMLFADQLRRPVDPETTRVQTEMQARVAELREEMKDIWGEEAETREPGTGNRENLEEVGTGNREPGAGEVVMDAEPTDGQAKVETAADIILKERGDFEIYDGTDAAGEPRMRSAAEVLTEARAAVAVEQQRRPLYQRAAVCLGLG